MYSFINLQFKDSIIKSTYILSHDYLNVESRNQLFNRVLFFSFSFSSFVPWLISTGQVLLFGWVIRLINHGIKCSIQGEYKRRARVTQRERDQTNRYLRLCDRLEYICIIWLTKFEYYITNIYIRKVMSDFVFLFFFFLSSFVFLVSTFLVQSNCIYFILRFQFRKYKNVQSR